MATNDKKDEKSEFLSPGGSGVSREVGQKFKHYKNAEAPHLGSLPLGGQKFPDKNWTMIRIFGIYVLRISGNAEGSRNPWVMKFHGRLGC